MLNEKDHKKTEFISNFRQQAEYLEEFADAIEESKEPDNVPIMFHIRPDTYLERENGSLELVEG